jgi:hypothetical protein
MVEKGEGGDCNHFDAFNNIIVFRSEEMRVRGGCRVGRNVCVRCDSS